MIEAASRFAAAISPKDARKNPRRSVRRGPTGLTLQRAQEVEDVLLASLAEIVEVGDDAVRLGAGARVLANGALEVRGPAVVQEEDPLSQAPQRSAAELPRAGFALAHAVRQSVAHVVHQ